MTESRGKTRRTLVVAITTTAAFALAIACSSNATFTAPDADSGVLDGGGDAFAAPDVAAPTWCQTHAATAAFCADFDEGDKTIAYLDGAPTHAIIEVPPDGGAHITPSSDSPPSALAFTMGPSVGDAGSTGSFVNGTSTESRATSYAFDVDFRLDLVGPNATDATIDLGGLFVGAGQTVTNYAFELSGGNVVLETSSSGGPVTTTTTTTSIGPAPAIGTWAHVAITISLESQIMVTAQLAIDTPVKMSIANPFSSGTLLYAGTALGISSRGQTSPAGVSFDNVTRNAFAPGPDAGAADGG